MEGGASNFTWTIQKQLYQGQEASAIVKCIVYNLGDNSKAHFRQNEFVLQASFGSSEGTKKQGNL